MDKREIIISLFEHSTMQRGIMIQSASNLEQKINLFISVHFCKEDKVIDLLQTLLCTNKITFDSKCQLAYEILLKNYPEQRFSSKTFCKQCETIAIHRNILAHCQVSIDDNDLEMFTKNKTICFIGYKSGKIKKHFFNQETMDLLYKIALSAMDLLEKIPK